jgi:hypothetical protein
MSIINMDSTQYWQHFYKNFFSKTTRTFELRTPIPLDSLLAFQRYSVPSDNSLRQRFGELQRYGLELSAETRDAQLRLCNEQFHLTIQEDMVGEEQRFFLLLKLADSGHRMGCNCAYRGRMWCYFFVGSSGMSVNCDIAGCYTYKLLSERFNRLLNHCRMETISVMVHLQCVKGFIADPESSLVYA